jgi:hypothetical protein
MEILMPVLPAILLLLTAAPAQAEAELRHTVLFQGKPSGRQITKLAEDGTIAVDYSYRNNGCGPDLKEEFTLAKDGTLLRYSAINAQPLEKVKLGRSGSA